MLVEAQSASWPCIICSPIVVGPPGFGPLPTALAFGQTEAKCQNAIRAMCEHPEGLERCLLATLLQGLVVLCTMRCGSMLGLH